PSLSTRLYSMVNDPSTDELIHWSGDGDSFFVPNHERFGKELLPRFFKHSNFSSFVRQLNMYGFHKVPHLQTGVLEPNSSTELWEFVNPNFLRDQPDLLPLVQRKKTQTEGVSTNLVSSSLDASSSQPTASSSKAGPSGTSSHPLDLQTVLSGITNIRAQQASISQELKDLQNSNAHLWQEALASRERHKRHQETTDRILRFLAGVFG
ncbi:hypothetical protein BDY24DRAFT_331417, partial [Mrakia frigida]|uniref:uncharacterized protein n=1 Tax=Mrakia frigida TaxID=29902 RepID=UPI003FCC19F6